MGSISGVARDHDGLPIENALIELGSDVLPETVVAYTNENGLFSIRNLPAGRYAVTYAYGQALRQRTFNLPAGARFRMNVRLYSHPLVVCILCDYGGPDQSLFSDTDSDAALLGRPRVIRWL